MDDKYSIGVSLEGTEQLIKDVKRANEAIDNLGKNSKGMQKLAAEATKVQQKLNNVGKAAEGAASAAQASMRALQSSSEATQKAGSGAAEKLKNLEKNLDFSKMRQFHRDMQRGWVSSTSELNRHTKQLEKLIYLGRKARNELAGLRMGKDENPEQNARLLREIREKYGRDVSQFLTKDYAKAEKMLQDFKRVSANTSRLKEESTLSRLMEQEARAATRTLAGAGNYQGKIRALQESLKLNNATERSLASQVKGVRQIQSEYESIKNAVGEIAQARQKQFEAKYGNSAFSSEAAEARRALIEQGEAARTRIRMANELRKTEADTAKYVASRVRDESNNRAYVNRVQSLREALKLQTASEASIRRQVEGVRTIEKAYQGIKKFHPSERAEATKQFVGKYGSEALNPEAIRTRRELLRSAEGYQRRLVQVKDLSGQIHSAWRGIAASTGNLWLSWGDPRMLASMAAGLAVGTSIFQSLKVNREFGWQMEQVGIAGEVSARQLGALKQQVLDINQAGSLQGPVQMASALRMLTQAGMTAEEALKNLPTVLDFALTAEISDDKASQFLAGLRSAFNLNTEQLLREGADQTAKAAAISQTSIEKMSEALKQASPEAARFGLSVADTSAALAILAKYNIEGSAAGTAMKRFLSDLAGRTPKATKALKELGLTIYNAQGMVKPFTQVVSEVQQKLSGMSDENQQKWLKSIFDERGLKTASILLSEAGKEFGKMHRETLRAGENMGYTQDAARRLGDTSEGAFRKMKNAWEGMFASVGNNVEAPFKDLMKAIGNLANDPAVRTVGTTLAEGFLTVSRAVVSTMGALTAFSPVIAGLGAAFTTVYLINWIKSLQASQIAMGIWSGVKARVTALKVRDAAATAADTAATNANTVATNANTVATRTNAAAGAAGVAADAARAAGKARLAGAAALLGRGVGALRVAFAALGGPVGVAATLIGTVATYAFASAEKQTLSLKDAVAQLDKSLGAVDLEKYEQFNKSGYGYKLDRRLGFDNPEADAQQRLLTPNHVNDYRENARRIVEATDDALRDIRQRTEASSQERYEQELMLTERKATLLQEQLKDFDKLTRDQNTLSEESKNIREDLERSLTSTMMRLAQQRTDFAIQQMRQLRIEAAETMGWWDKLTSFIGDTDGNRARMRLDTLVRLDKSSEGRKTLTPEDVSFMTRVKSGQDVQTAHAATSSPVDSSTVNLYKNLALSADGIAELGKQLRDNPTQARVQMQAALQGIQESITQARQYATLNGGNTRGRHVEESSRAAQTLLTLLNDTEQAQKQQIKAQNADRTTGGVGVDPTRDRSPSSNESGKGPTSRTTVSAYNPIDAHTEAVKRELEARKTLIQEIDSEYSKRKRLGLKLSAEQVKELAESYVTRAQLQQDTKIQDLKGKYMEVERKIRGGNMSDADRAALVVQRDSIGRKIKELSGAGEIYIGSVGQVTTTTVTGSGEGLGSGTGSYSLGSYGKGGAANWVTARVTDRFGTKRDYGRHAGVDLGAAYGTELVAPIGGVVSGVTRSQTGGLTLTVKTDDGAEQKFLHLSDTLMKVGERFEAGMVLAKTGNSGVKEDGSAYKPHLHQEYSRNGVRIDPTKAGAGKAGVPTSGTSSRLKSEQVNKKGEHSTTNETRSYRTEAITLTNKEEGAGATLYQASLEAEKAIVEERRKLIEFANSEYKTISDSLEVKRLELEADRSMGKLTAQQYQDRKYALDVEKLHADNKLKTAEIMLNENATAAQLLQVQQEQTAELARQLELLGKKAAKEAESKTAKAGATSWLTSIRDQAQNNAKFTSDMIESVYGKTMGALDTLVEGGKVKFSEFRRSVIADLAKIAARMAMMKLINLAASAFGAPTAVAATGGVFTPSGRLSTYAAGGVVTSPTYFGMANGGRGLMGENGPEAVMPLKRLANGDLDVQAIGGGGTAVNAPVVVNVQVNNDGSGGSSGDVSANGALGKELGEAIRATVMSVLGKELRPNGMIDTAIRAS